MVGVTLVSMYQRVGVMVGVTLVSMYQRGSLGEEIVIALRALTDWTTSSGAQHVLAL